MRHGVVLLPWLCGLASMLWLTAEWRYGFGEHSVELEEAVPAGSGVFQVSIPALETLGWFEVSAIPVDLLEDGRPLGPRLSEPSQVAAMGGAGAFTLPPVERHVLASHHSVKQTLSFSASDSGDVRHNGRTYTLRWSRRTDSNALLVVVVSWFGFFMLVRRRWHRSSMSPPSSGSSALAIWSVVLPCAGFTLFALFGARASLTQPWPWLYGLALCSLPGLWRVRSVCLAQRGWSWLLAFLVLMVATVAAGPFASVAVFRELMFGVAAGGLGFVVLCHQAEGVKHHRQTVARALAWACGLLAILLVWRQAGFRIAADLASISPVIHSTSWQDKFSENWLLVLFWVVIALTPGGRGRRSSWIAAVALIGFALLFSSTLTFKLASILSVATFLAARWLPSLTRRGLIAATLVAVLGAPWIAAGAWQVSLASAEGKPKVDRVRLARRAGIWEYARRLTWHHPLSGEGIGASRQLPGRKIPLGELIPVPPGSLAGVLDWKPALAGGHAHSFALQVWLELGPAGALLLAGLMVTLLPSVRSREHGSEVVAAQLALYVAVMAFLLANYPLWSPSIVCLVFFAAGYGAVVGTAHASVAANFRRWWLAPWSLLALAVLVMGIERGQRWWQIWATRHADILLSLEDGAVIVDGREHRLTHQAVGEFEILAGDGPESLLIRGWAIDRSQVDAVDHVIVFHDQRPHAVVSTGLATPDFHATTSKEDLSTLFAGFETRIRCEPPCRTEAVEVALFSRDGQASLATSPHRAAAVR